MMSWVTLLDLLVFGLPGERPGGLMLTVLAFLGAAGGGFVLGGLYAVACVAMPSTSWALMAGATLFRGVPPILLVFALAHLSVFSPVVAGIAGLVLYSFSHTGETLRAYLVIYPRPLADAARVAGFHPIVDWPFLRLGWSVRQGMSALTTHWISLLKDTGALVILGIGELSTTAKLISESTANLATWTAALGTAAVLYMLATIALLGILNAVHATLNPSMPPERAKATT
jgi:ABC-type amino acid transport system permease subunit